VKATDVKARSVDERYPTFQADAIDR